MSKETKLIVKIILLNLLFGFIIFAFLSSKATDYPPFPTAWKVGQRVHVKFTYFSPEDKIEMISYIKKQIEPLNLDIKLVFDDNLKARADGITEGIEFRNTIGTTTVCDKTGTVGGYDEVNKEWVVWKVIKHDITCEDTGYRSAHPIAWTNALFHEFNHALLFGNEHIPNRDGIIPPVLMFADNNLKDIPELFSFADKWQLKRKYSGRAKVVNYKRMNFKRADVGKYCFLVRGNRSVGFRVEQQSELLPYLGDLSKYRRVIK